MADKNIYTVIVADDEDELREAVCTMIPWEALGFHLVGSASNGLDALELVERLEPDLLLTDIRMPFLSGIALARAVREIRPAMHIAFLSGYDDFTYAQQAIQYNIISYMLKPITLEELKKELCVIREKISLRYQEIAQGRAGQPRSNTCTGRLWSAACSPHRISRPATLCLSQRSPDGTARRSPRARMCMRSSWCCKNTFTAPPALLAAASSRL